MLVLNGPLNGSFVGQKSRKQKKPKFSVCRYQTNVKESKEMKRVPATRGKVGPYVIGRTWCEILDIRIECNASLLVVASSRTRLGTHAVDAIECGDPPRAWLPQAE